MKISSLRKGISPIIATVIIVAVTIAIAVAVVGWFIGLWTSLAGGTPAISVTAVTGNYTSGVFYVSLYLRNTGSGSDKLVKAEFVYNGTSFKCYVLNQKGGKVLSLSSASTITKWSQTVYTYPIIVNANSEAWVIFICDGNTENVKPSPGDKGIMKLYFSSSGAQSFTVVISTVK